MSFPRIWVIPGNRPGDENRTAAKTRLVHVGQPMVGKAANPVVPAAKEVRGLLESRFGKLPA